MLVVGFLSTQTISVSTNLQKEDVSAKIPALVVQKAAQLGGRTIRLHRESTRVICSVVNTHGIGGYSTLTTAVPVSVCVCV